MSGEQVQCPLCGADVTMAAHQRLEDGTVIALVVSDPGTFYAHLRDEHPEHWEEACERRRKMNTNPFIGCMPRKVDGTFMRAGEDVDSIATRSG